MPKQVQSRYAFFASQVRKWEGLTSSSYWNCIDKICIQDFYWPFETRIYVKSILNDHYIFLAAQLSKLKNSIKILLVYPFCVVFSQNANFRIQFWWTFCYAWQKGFPKSLLGDLKNILGIYLWLFYYLMMAYDV